MSYTVNNNCDICHINPGIGVASTSVPCSVMYCTECATRGSDPEWVFEYWYGEIGEPNDLNCPDNFNTFKDGKYITYREWYALKTK